MERQILRDFYYKVIGYIDTDENGVQWLRDPQYRVLGKYEPTTNLTRDFYGVVIGHGNILTTLLK